MTQNENQLMSIGEVGKALGITRRIILNYEDKGLITPDRKDGTTGNRYYTPDTLTRIRTIRIMQNFGFSLDEIYTYYNGMTDLKPLIMRLEKLRDEINLNIEKLKERVKGENDFEISIVTIPSQTIYRKIMCDEDVETKKIHLRDVFTTAIRQYGSDISKRMFYIQYSLDNPALVSYCIAVPPASTGEDIFHLPEEKALCIFYHGSYESIPSVRNKLISYAKENNIPLKGFCQHIYLEGPPQHKDPENFITQVALLIK